MKRLFGVACAAILAYAAPGAASSLFDVPLEVRVERADAVFRGEVAGVRAFRPGGDGRIFTRTAVRVLEVYKGHLPPTVILVHRGGVLEGDGEADGFAPAFRTGEQRLLFVKRRADGSLGVAHGLTDALPLGREAELSSGDQGAGTQTAHRWLAVLRERAAVGPLPGADITDQAANAADLLPPREKLGAGPGLKSFSSATNLFEDVNGISARYLAPDRGEAIPYYVDADALPAGMTQVQALKAVSDALLAWSKVTSLKFSFAGMRSFGMASADVQASDAALRIQLHDIYQYITGAGELLGRGGIRWSAPVNGVAAGWTSGGNVSGNDFNRAVAGWVVLQHSNPFMRDLANFTEVLCHELGHALSISHSSNDPGESNPVLRQALMYYMVHGDGRGAALNVFDTNVIQQASPVLNTPPFCFERVIDAISTPTNMPGLNRIRFAGYDLQTTNVDIATAEATSLNGSFLVAGQVIQYDPAGFFNGPRFDPDSTEYYDMVYARAADGTNASPYVPIRVISFKPDTYYEGIPDDWRLTHFGSNNPAAGPNRRANQDFDQDGFSNLREYRLGSDPSDPQSNLHLINALPGLLRWDAKPFEVYELQSTTDLNGWGTTKTVMPTNTPVSVSITTTNGNRFYRVLKVP